MTDVRPSSGGTVRSVLEEERDFFLRSLRDLEAERAAGDIDDIDYQSLHSDYTARAASVLRRLDALDSPPAATEEVAPPPVASAPVASAGGASGTTEGAGDASRRGVSRRRRLVLAGAAAAIAAAGIGWAVVASSGSRLPGGTVSGQAVGQEQVGKLLLAAQQATAKGDGVTALKDLEAVLKQDPNQVEALASEGWILAQTQQPQLLQQGIGLLTKAEQLNPGYPPARVYRGVAYLAEHDYADAVGDLQWYLAHDPDPGLVTRVRQALAEAQAGAAQPAPVTTVPASAG